MHQQPDDRHAQQRAHDVRGALATLRAARRRQLLLLACAVPLLGLVLSLLCDAYWTRTLISSLALAVAASGVALLYGQLGLVSLCQFALLGVGGWTSLRLSHGLHLPFELCVLAAGASAALLGMLAGLPALRMRGLYLALVTLMMAGAFQVLVNVTGFPDGGAGWLGRVEGSERLLMARPALAQTDSAYLVYVSIWLAAMLVLIQLHRSTRAGRAWALIRRGDAAALGAGVNILFYQGWAFALAGFCAGVGGALLAGGIGQLDGRAFGASESIMLFALTVVGGVQHWLGALVAGLLLRAVPGLLTNLGVNGYLSMILFGAALLHALFSAQGGLAAQLLRLGSATGRLLQRLRAKAP